MEWGNYVFTHSILAQWYLVKRYAYTEINLADTNLMCRIKMATKMIFKDAVFTFQSQINRQFVP